MPLCLRPRIEKEATPIGTINLLIDCLASTANDGGNDCAVENYSAPRLNTNVGHSGTAFLEHLCVPATNHY